ncbi:AI-2E family transporter [Risungbinella massiliensis]|uniref:AI-2E family transporter n=1 Tax=Risungbinella massiliensis TaxID=1329796 RepID=UPI0005CBD3E5|nr:AI-2E family transporter [Risungbinella massiliensis]
MPKSKPFLLGYGTIVILLIIFLGTKVSFIFRPIVIFFQTLFFPFLLAGVLFYLFRPVVMWLHRFKIPKQLSIILIYLLFTGIVVLLGFLIGPPLTEQVERLVENFPDMWRLAETRFQELSKNPWVTQNVNWDELSNYVVDYLQNSYQQIGTNIASFFGVLTDIVVVFVTVPFILYYMLSEGHKAPAYFLKFFPEREQREQGSKILHDLDHALSSYIKGQVLVSIFVGVLVYIGYLIIGIEYPLILALVSMFTNIIPFIGPLIGTVPALIVGLISEQPFMAVKVLIVALVAQQLEGNVVSPLVMGKNLNIHPLTIILILLVAGSLGGFLGLLLGVPVYAVAKVVISHIYRFMQLRRTERNES